jgi:hypothetical protein
MLTSRITSEEVYESAISLPTNIASVYREPADLVELLVVGCGN